MSGEYLIWSNEHRAWWRPKSQGYTVRTQAAGRYTREEAIAICASTRDGWRSETAPSEIPVALDDVIECVVSLAQRLMKADKSP